MLKSFFTSILLILALPAYSLSEKGQILQVSKSGRSMVWGKGVFEGVRKGSTGVFVYKGATGTEKVAIGEVVRVLSEKSYWILRDIEKPEALVNNQTLFFLGDDSLLRGRIPERIKRKKVVLSKGQRVSDFEKDQERGGVPDQVVKLENDFREGPPLKVAPQREDFTMETIDYTTWLDDGLKAVEEYDEVLESKKIGKFKRPVEADVLQKKSKEETADSTSKGIIRRMDYKKMESVDRTKMIDNKFVRMREREGPLWSADLDDKQLRRYVLETGMVEEKKRQEFAMENRFFNEFVLRFNKAFPSAKSSQYASNQADSYSWAFGYELHLMRLTRVLDSFSIEAFLEYGNGYYEMGAANVRSNEWAFNLSASWYFLNLPSNVAKVLGHVGLGGRLGQAALDSASFTKAYEYQLRSFPWYYIEFKYRFGTDNDDMAWGISAMLSYLNSELTVMETLLDDISGAFQTDEIRWSLGLNFTI